MDKQIRIIKWMDEARKYIESDAINKKLPLAIELVKEHDEIIKEFKGKSND